MKLTDFLCNIGKPVAYYPKLKRITGSTTATILLCQFIYWRGKEKNVDGCLYKTSEEIENETGLTYNEQKTARKLLVKLGILQEHNARLYHQMRFKIDIDKINEIWGITANKNGESDDSTLGNDESPYSLNSNTEITTEKKTSSVINATPLTIENAIYAGLPVTEEMAERASIENNAPRMFERALGFSKPLPWGVGKEWEEFRVWVCDQYAESKTIFGEYNIWRNTPYTKGGMSNNRIRGFVKEFYDSWDMFMMSRRRTDEQRPEYKPIKQDDISAVPNPLRKPVIT